MSTPPHVSDHASDGSANPASDAVDKITPAYLDEASRRRQPGKRPRVDRGIRPATRGWFHFGAAIASLVTGTSLTTYAFTTLAWWQALGVLIYSIGGLLLFGVSAAYHRGPWHSIRTVNWWRRADHATIAVFIAATYTPLCLLVLSPTAAAWLLSIAWLGAIAAAVMNLVWIDHPRFLDVIVYLALGWLIIPLAPQVWQNAGPAVIFLLLAGGITYSLGALVYGFKWPGREARIYGYHEHFHTATIVASVFHYIAVWVAVAISN